jgi:hypothetical protein
MNKRTLYIIIGLLVVALVGIAIAFVTCSGPDDDKPVPTPSVTPTLTVSAAPTPAIPLAPVNLTVTSQSSRIVMLNWQDNSTDEDGFILYRNAVEITRTGPNATSFQDTSLLPSTTYQYSLKAFNKVGESGTAAYTFKTPNPGATIRLTRIGVYDNREDVLRGTDGEIYLHIVISDGKNPAKNIRLPQTQDQEYKLAKNETMELDNLLFSTSELGDHMTLTIIGYERDGADFEPLVYQAIETAIKLQVGGVGGLILNSFDVNLAGLIGQFMGEADDWLGSYEKTWDAGSNWGAGNYDNIVCQDENGVDCLRLWFTVTVE